MYIHMHAYTYMYMYIMDENTLYSHINVMEDSRSKYIVHKKVAVSVIVGTRVGNCTATVTTDYQHSLLPAYSLTSVNTLL